MTKASLITPIGTILVHCDGALLRSIAIAAERPAEWHDDAEPASVAAEAARQLQAYFADGFATFDLPLTPSPSRRGEALRAAIMAIPAGATQSYGAIARQAQSSPRAIGQACARNPFPIVVPCHRVVGTKSKIGHYSAGRGIITKTWLLDHERRGGLL